MYMTLGERSKIFGIFMLAFQYPDKEFIEHLQNGNLYFTIQGYLEDVFANNTNEGLLEELDDLLKEYSSTNTENLFSDLKTEYHRLFIGYKKLLAPPYASVYWDSTGKLMQEPAILLKRLYKEWGFEVSKNYKDLPDHISLQLEFLYQLGEIMNKGSESILYDVQKRVIDDIILKWIYKFAENINNYQSLKFYGLMVKILVNVLEQY